MELSPEEEQRIREEIRTKLEQTLEAKQRERELRDRKRREQVSERERQRIFEEEERKFYKARGLQRYINRYGEVEWLTPEEIRERRLVGKERYRIRRKKKRIQRWMAVGRVFVLVLVIGGLGAVLYSMRSLRGAEQEDPVTVLWVRSNVPGAAIYVDGNPTGITTDGLIGGPLEGKHVVAVAKPGYVVVPAKQEVWVTRGDTTEVAFELTVDYW